jgi:glycosyltransferase involved in cell wall biosynthesis
VRRLLFLSYWLPPRNAIGTLRSIHILKHLPKFGWDVTALTAQFDDACNGSPKLADYIETGYWDVKGAVKRAARLLARRTGGGSNENAGSNGAGRGRAGTLLYELSNVLSYPDDCVGWLPFAAYMTGKVLARGKWDAVLTSAPPMTTNVAAAIAHRNVPWVADLRDLWAENDSTERAVIQRLFDDRLERASLSQAAALIAASELSARRFRARYPDKPCFAISGGFDADEWQAIPFEREERCTLLYAGTLYGGKRDPSALFAALREILDQQPHIRGELRVDFYAQRDEWLTHLIERFELQDIVRVHGFIERDAVLAAQRRADRLIVLSWDGPTAEGVVAGKLFEYFGARRRVLAIGGPRSFAIEEILRETGAGVRCTTTAQIKAEVLAAIAEHRSGEACTIDESAVSMYSGEMCARRIAGVLDAVLARGHAQGQGTQTVTLTG